MVNILCAAFILFMMLVHGQIAIGYDEKRTHPDLTDAAVKRSVLKTYLPQYCGSGFSKGYDSKINDISVIKLIKDGAIAEDDVPCRRASHFHNPLLPWGQSSLNDVWWTDICTVKYSAVTKATRYLSPPPTGQKTDVQPWFHHWDYARTTYYEALTAADNALRSNDFAYTFLTLGHVLHLLQDMGVPAHTRNDFASHLISVNGKKRQPHEHYVRENYNVATAATVTPLFANTRLTDFWDTDQYNGSNPSTFTDIGLAEFSNANYFSDFTIPNNGTTPEHTFPYPHLSGANISGPNYQVCSYQFYNVASVKYVSRTNNGPCPPTAVSADRFAVVSLMNMPGTSSDINSISHVWLNDEVHEQYAQELLPRAIGYSASLLDYFFRGTLEVSWPETGVYSIADGSQTPYTDVNGNNHQQFTKIKAAILNTTPNEPIGAGTLTAVARYKIMPNYAPDLSNYPPNGAIMTAVQYSYSVSQPFAVNGISAADYTDIPFDFAPSPIPAGITDLTLQVVFKGTIGNEADNAIAVGMKDITEPTHLTFWNLSDMFSLQYPGSDYELYTFGTLQTMVQTDPTLLNWLDDTHYYSLDDELYLQPLPITFTISFWNGLTLNPAVTVNIPAGGHIRPIVLVNQSANNYFELQWVDPVQSGSVTLPFTGVVNQANQSGAYSTPTPVDTFRKKYAPDGQTLVPILQHNYTGIVGCKPSTGGIYCPYSDEDAVPVTLEPTPFTSVFN